MEIDNDNTRSTQFPIGEYTDILTGKDYWLAPGAGEDFFDSSRKYVIMSEVYPPYKRVVLAKDIFSQTVVAFGKLQERFQRKCEE